MTVKILTSICKKIKPIRHIHEVKVELPTNYIKGSVNVTSNVRAIDTFSIQNKRNKQYVIIPIPNGEVPDGLEIIVTYNIFVAMWGYQFIKSSIV